jgi:monofunctional biosynthetic peptidoglycan transglycosylase
MRFLGRRLRWPGLGRIGRWLVRLAAGFVLLSVGLVLLYAVVPPPGTPLMLIRALGGAGIDRDWVPLEAVSPDLFRAVIAAEDTSFCTHHGFDWESIWAAWRRDQRNGGRLRGGSTISQQTAKNLFLWPVRTYVRKAVEAWFTVLLELFLEQAADPAALRQRRRMGPTASTASRRRPATISTSRRRA